jgi:nucleoside-diphosphate-sugar epimerase
MRALVTGATGLVGFALCRRLDSHEVTAFVRSPGKRAERRIAVDHIVEGEITDRKAVEQAVRGAEVVFGIAATFHEPQLTDESCRAVNVGGTRNLIEAARQHGVRRVVHCSTVGIHGLVELRR